MTYLKGAVKICVVVCDMATDLDGYGGVEPNLPECGNGFTRTRVLADFVLNMSPPRTTTQSGTKILRRKNGTYFVGRPRTHKATQARNELKLMLMPHRPIAPYAEALHVEVAWNFPYKKTETKKNRELKWIPHAKRPDCDNLMKGLFDVMTECGYWTDDGLIASISFIKTHSQKPSLAIKISAIL